MPSLEADEFLCSCQLCMVCVYACVCVHMCMGARTVETYCWYKDVVAFLGSREVYYLLGFPALAGLGPCDLLQGHFGL